MGDTTLLERFEQQSKKLDMLNQENKRLRFSLENNQENDKKFKDLLNTIPIPIFIIRKSDSEILFANTYFSEMFGVKENTIVGHKTINFFCDLSDRKIIRNTLQEKGFIKSFEFRAKTMDGKIIWLVTSSRSTIFQGEDAYISGFYDISQRKQAGEELEESQEKVMLALEGTDQGLWEWDVVTGQIIPSENWCRIMGYVHGEIQDNLTRWESSLQPEILLAFKKTIKDFLKGKDKYYEFEYKIKNKSGEWRWIWERGTCLAYGEQGEPLRIIGIDRDITIRKKLEQELMEMNKSLDKKVNERSIELKRLNENIVNSEENERKAIASELHDGATQTIGLCISKINNFKESGSVFGLDTISQIRDYLCQIDGEIRSIIYQLRPPVLDDFAIDIAIGFLVEESNDKHQAHIEYINNLDEPVHLIWTSKITLYRAVSELIANILKHSGTLEAQVELSKIKNNIQVRVEDEGSGFDIKSKNNSNFSGFGLFGLSERLISVEGEIKVNSTIGKGTKVVISVPINM